MGSHFIFNSISVLMIEAHLFPRVSFIYFWDMFTFSGMKDRYGVYLLNLKISSVVNCRLDCFLSWIKMSALVYFFTGEDTIIGDQSISMDDFKFLADDSISPRVCTHFCASVRFDFVISKTSL